MRSAACQKPWQAHRDQDPVLQDLDRAVGVLPERAQMKIERVAGPHLLLERHERAERSLDPAQALLEPAHRLRLAEAMRDRSGDGRAHGEGALAYMREANAKAANRFTPAQDRAAAALRAVAGLLDARRHHPHAQRNSTA